MNAVYRLILQRSKVPIDVTLPPLRHAIMNQSPATPQTDIAFPQ